jgi:hypothetical protein
MSFLDNYFIIFWNFNIYTKFGALLKIADTLLEERRRKAREKKGGD